MVHTSTGEKNSLTAGKGRGIVEDSPYVLMAAWDGFLLPYREVRENDVGGRKNQSSGSAIEPV